MNNLDLNYIVKYIKEMFREYMSGGNIVFERFLLFDNFIYRLNFEIGPQNSSAQLYTIENSVDKYNSYLIQNYIRKATLKKENKPLKIYFEVSPGTIYTLFIKLKKINDNHVFIYNHPDTQAQSEIMIQKVLQIIKNAGNDGISRTNLYNSTRRWLSNTERENIILSLSSQDKIKIRHRGSAKKQQQVYYAR